MTAKFNKFVKFQLIKPTLIIKLLRKNQIQMTTFLGEINNNKKSNKNHLKKLVMLISKQC